MVASGYRHHTYEEERRFNYLLFSMERDDLLEALGSPRSRELLLRYTDVLGPTRLRALKNSLICLISPLCRDAIDFGVNVELSFALSDHYITVVESLDREDDLLALAAKIELHYFDLVHEAQEKRYSRPIATAVRHIGRTLHGVCRVADAAAAAGLEPHYFSTVFRAEVGESPSRYILRRKMDEARRMLGQPGTTVTDVAQSLGFSDVAHFSRRFKAVYGVPPSRIARLDMPLKISELPS